MTLRSIVNTSHARECLEAAIAGLRGLTAESLNYEPSAVEHFVASMIWLQEILDEIDGVSPTETGEVHELVGPVALRICSLSAEVEREQKLCMAVIEGHEQRLAEAKFAGCLAVDLPQYPHAEVTAYRANIESMEAELGKLEAFLASPDHNVSLLSGTEFYQSPEGN